MQNKGSSETGDEQCMGPLDASLPNFWENNSLHDGKRKHSKKNRGARGSGSAGSTSIVNLLV